MIVANARTTTTDNDDDLFRDLPQLAEDDECDAIRRVVPLVSMQLQPLLQTWSIFSTPAAWLAAFEDGCTSGTTCRAPAWISSWETELQRVPDIIVCNFSMFVRRL